MDTKEMNLLGIVAFVGAILMVVGVFLAWLTVNLGLGETSTSGWNVYTESSGSLKYTFAPLVCLICGILQLVVMILPTFMNGERFAKINNVLGLLALILAIVAVIVTALFQFQKFDNYGLIKIGIGCWICLVGAIITAVGGLTPVVKNRFMS